MACAYLIDFTGTLYASLGRDARLDIVDSCDFTVLNVEMSDYTQFL